MKTAILIFLTLLTGTGVFAQAPTYVMTLQNDSLVSPTVYEFDIRIARGEGGGNTEFQLASLQPIMTFNTAISGGALSLSIVGGTSGLNALQQPNVMSVTGNELRINPRTPPGAGNGTIIPVSPGLRVGRFRLTSTVPFNVQQAGIAWKNAADPYTKVFAYNLADLNVEITDSSSNINSLSDPSLSPPVISSTSPRPAGTAGVLYRDTLRATGGTAPYSWALVGGSLPAGLSLSGTGIITGTANVAGQYNFTAMVTDSLAGTDTASFSLTINPAAARRLAFIQQPTEQAAGVFISPPVTVRLNDSLGNPVSMAGVGITMSLTSGNGVLSGSLTETTNASGIASFDSLRVDKKGIKTITASSAITTSTASSPFNIISSSATQVIVETAADGSGTVVPAQNVTAGSSVTMYAITRDAFDNFIENVAASAWSLQGVTGGVAGGDLVPAGDMRSAVFTGHLAGSAQARATSPSLTPVNTGTLTVNPGSAVRLTFVQQPSSTVAGAVIAPPVTVQVRDTANNPVAVQDVSVSLSLSSGTGNLTGTIPRLTNATGLATFDDLTIDSSGLKALTAVSAGLTSAVSNNFTMTTYTITASAGANGSINPSGAVAVNSGATQAFTITPNSGFHIADVLVDGGTVGAVPTYTFTNVTANHTIAASFAPDTVQVTVQTSPAGRSITVDGSSFTAPQIFQWVSGSVHTIATDSLQNGAAGVRYLYSSWSEGGAISHSVSSSADTTFTASFNTQYFLTTSAGTGGTASPPSDWKNSGEVVQISGSPNTGYSFSGWAGTGTGSFTGITNPVNITMNGPITEAASFTANAISVTVTTNPAGRTITVDGTSYTSPQVFNWTATQSHTIGVDSIQAGATGVRYLYTSWSDTGAISHTVTPLTNTTFTANFSTQYFLTTVAGTGGSVLPASGWRNPAEIVNISATPVAGYSFGGWTGTGTGSFTGATNPVNITMNGPITETATFIQNPISVTVTTVPVGQSITVDGVNYVSPQIFNWLASDTHTIATDSLQSLGAGSRAMWTSWSDAGARSHTVAPLVNSTYTASFTTQHFLTMTANAGGSVTPPSDWFTSGQSVIITATPDSGFVFNSWTGTGTGSYTGSANPRTISVSAPITETANFGQPTVLVTILTNPSGRTFYVNGSPATNTFTFSMNPGSSVTLSTDTLQAQTAASRYKFTDWSDGGAFLHTYLYPGANDTVTVNFKRQFYLTMNASTGGSVLPASGWHDSAQVVGISATPTTGYTFTGWTGSGTGSYSGPNNPGSVTMNGAVTETGNFSLAPISVTIQTVPAGRTFIADAVTYTAPQTFTWSATATHSLSTLSPQGDTLTQYLFASWSDGGTQTHNVAPLTDTTFTLNFTTQHRLTMSSSGPGSVSPPNGWYNAGQSVQISATADPGYLFSSWTGSGNGSYSGSNNPANVTMNAPVNETGNFTAGTTAVTVTTSPAGLLITVDGVGYTSPQVFNWTTGSTHTIVTDSIQNSGTPGIRYRWTNWSDAGARSHTVSPTSPTTYTANFGNQYMLTMGANPGGTVTPPSGWYDAGATVTITGLPNPGYGFTTWSGTGSGSYTGTQNPRDITMGGVVTETANFSQLPVQVTILTNPAGRTFYVNGQIATNTFTFTLNPGGSASLSTDSIQAQTSTTRWVYTGWSDGGARTHTYLYPGMTDTVTVNFKRQYFLTMATSTGGSVLPASGWFDSAQVVGITATPSGGYTFSGWTGTGTGSYTGPANPGSVTMNGAVTETASFTLAPINVTVQSNPAGRTFTVDGTDYTGTQAFVWSATDLHTLSTTSPQGDTMTRYIYSSWSDGGAQSHPVAPASDTTFTVNFSTQHFLTMATGAGLGSVLPANGWFNAGEVVQISATPDPGYNFGSWSGTGTGSYTGTNNPANVTMNSPVLETANFTAGTIPVTVTTVPSGLSITVDGTGYTSPQVFNWTTGSTHTIATDSIQPSGVSGSRYRWTAWSDTGSLSHTVAPTAARTFTATFGTQYMLTMTANPGGTVDPPTGWHDAGSTVTITGIPDPSFSFSSWSGSGSGGYSGNANPRNITINGPITEIANFVQNPYQVIVQTNPPGRTFRVSGTNYTTMQTFSVSPGNIISLSIPQNPQSGGPGVQFLWANWTDSGAISHNFTPTSDTIITANFTTQYFLTMNAGTGGTVSPPSDWHDAGSDVEITATPTGGYTFAGWTGSGSGNYTGPNNPANVTMNAPVTETASFTLFPITVRIRSNPPGRTVMVDSIAVVTPQDVIWTSGTTHEIAGDSVQDGTTGTRYIWTGWSDGGARTHNVTGLTDTTFTMNFRPQYFLTMNAGTGGTAAPASSWYDSAMIVPITATPSGGYSFAGWTGTGSGSYTGTVNPSSVAMLAPVSETAAFSINTVSVTVTTNPAGYPVTVDDTVYTSPHVFSWLAGSSHTIRTDSTQPVSAGTRLAWSSWSDGGARGHTVVPITDTAFTATLVTQYYLTMNNNPGGTSTPPNGWFNAGQGVVITAIPDSGYTFTTWSGSGTGSYSGGNNPRNIFMGGPITETANYAQNTVLVTIMTQPAGRSFRVDGFSYTTINTFSFLPGSSHNFSADSLQPGPSGANGRRYIWRSWSDSGTRSHNYDVPGTDTSLLVSFGLQYELVTTASPAGSGTINPPGQSFHNAGDTISVTATAANGFAFTSWSGAATGTSNPVSLVMDTTKALTANFSPAAIVMITSDPPGRTIVVDGFSYVAPDTFSWLLGSKHDIGTVTPQDGNVGTRHLFSSWSDSGSLSHSITVGGDTTFNLDFTTEYYLYVGAADTNGTVGPAEGWQESGTVVEITATAKPGFGFVEWVGTGPASYSGFSNPVSITMDGWATQMASFGQLLPPPALAGIQNGAMDQPIAPRLTWMSYAGATSYIVQVATDSFFSPMSNVVDSSGIADTSIQLPLLLNFETYYWRVKAKAGPDITSFSETRRFTTLKPTIMVNTPGLNWGTTYTYDIDWTAQNLSGRVDVMLSTDGGQTFSILDSNVSGTSTRWTIPLSQTPSNFCRLRVASTSKPELYAEGNNFAIVPGSLPLLVPLTATISFPAEPTISTFYRLVSIPGVVDTSIHLSTYVPGSNPGDWRMFADNGQPANYLVELGPSNHFETGRGYWLVKRNNLSIAMEMVMPPLDTLNAVHRIKVRSGWNIIANPFDKNVAWSTVVALNGLPPSTELYGFNGSYQATNTMAPFRAYYFFNGNSLTELRISYPFGASTTPPVAGRNAEWQIQLSYRSDINEDPSNFIGVAPAAKDGLDELDGYKPPLFLDQGFLYFKRPEWNPEYSLFNADFRPGIGEGQTWEFEVSREYGTTGTISFEGVGDVPPEYEVVLLNSFNSTPVNLREKPSYSFRSVSTTMPFKVLVGPAEYVRAQVTAETPTEFELEQNFPNPFNSTTSISVKLPRDAKISLDIFSVLGQKVRTLAEGEYTGGVHTFLWEGTDDNRMPVATGVYIYRLTDGASLLQSKKMIIVK